MADIRVFAQQVSPSRASDGQLVGLRALRDGAAIVVPWYQALVLEGRVFSAAGPIIYDHTGLTLLGTYNTASSTLGVDIPDGLAGIPLYQEGSYLATGGLQTDAFGFVSPVLLAAGTAVTARNLRLDNPLASGATATHTASGGGTIIAATMRTLWHFSSAQDLDATTINPRRWWSACDAGYAPVCIDAGSICLNVENETSGTGFALTQWAELPESAIK